MNSSVIGDWSPFLAPPTIVVRPVLSLPYAKQTASSFDPVHMYQAISQLLLIISAQLRAFHPQYCCVNLNTLYSR
jgi:hypothetical protein